MLARCLIGEDWWYDDAAAATGGRGWFDTGSWKRKRAVRAWRSVCGSCEFTHWRLGRGDGWRPTYPFAAGLLDLAAWLTEAGCRGCPVGS